MTQILITGGGGFIGARLARALLADAAARSAPLQCSTPGECTT